MVAQLLPIDLVSPGFRGVNFEQAYDVLDPVWATVAQNGFINRNGRLTSRKGYSDVTTTAISATPDVLTLHEYIKEDATTEVLVAWDGGIGNDIDDPEGNDVSGAITDADGNWNFQNFNNKVIGFQNGQKPVVYSGSTFATVSEASGTAPTIADGVGLCAFGRVWGLDSDRQTIKFSALLDETNWLTGAGQIDMANVWTNGHDLVTAIIAFNGALVVFGHHHIVFWVDGAGNQLGIDPDNLYVADVVTGTGCESWESIQPLGDADVIFAGRNGIQSLGRVKSAGSAPIYSLSKYQYREFVNELLAVADKREIRSVVFPEEGLYLLTFPTAGRTWVIHYNKPFQDNEGDRLFPVTTWDLAPTAWLWRTSASTLLLGFAGNVGQYGGADDDNGTRFLFEYEGPWLNLGEQLANRLKILKRIGAIIFAVASTTVNFKWDFDFEGNWKAKSFTYAAGGAAEYNIAEYNIDEFSGGLALRISKFPAYGTGQYIRLGLTAEIYSQLSIQQLELFAKLGRYA